ncbi:hypothetical protein LOK49_LG05G00623 [Camellia lanceoleosa]|uniref:Uncharacterized protein n=1 Tax=Camellia lanceoleosa TaxID=1840588 RepID=A0ACC0HKU1_9ERIC|nr:hypothetical protein LOK49_LG05G00623 [Camellia lanceoleosa]
MDKSKKIDLELKRSIHVDVSSENNNFIVASSSSTSSLCENQSSGTRKSGKCNLRKSLEWDTAFFTSAGILDPDELSSMIEGVDKGRKLFVPGIEEEMCRSTDSLSTLESDLTLESLEADLFEDNGASIQKSSKASHMASSSKAPSGETETQHICTLKKVDLTSKNMPVARNGGPTSSLEKAPKVIGRRNPISSAALKRSSLCSNQVKIENDKEKSASVPGKVAPSTKIHGLGGSCRTLHKPALSSKASSSSSSTLTKTKPPPKSSSLTDSSGSASSANVGISPVNPTRRKIVSRSINPTSSGSILKTQAKVALKKKGQSGLSAGLMSSKLSSNNTSPASSISEWPSESSSSTSTVNQRSNTSRASIDTRSPCTSLDNGAALSAIDFDFSICESISMDKSKKIDLELKRSIHVDVSSENNNFIVASSSSTSSLCENQSSDPDDLSSTIEGVDKGRKLFVPGIEEETCRSTDSLSTLESDLTLESLEADLFKDIGVSIQKSNKASHMASSSKTPSGEAKTQPICTLKKVDLTSKNMPVARNGGPTSSLEKAPKVIGRRNPISSAALKRSSLCSNQVKIENDKEKSASGK